MPKLNIYSHNVCWTRRRKGSDIIATKIQELQPDIACLQECGFASQIKKLKLEGYYQSFVPVRSTKLGNTVAFMLMEKPKIGTLGGLMILSKQKPVKVEFVPFGKQIKFFPHALAFLVEKIIHRGFLVCEFEDFVVINVHLTADFKKKWKDKNTTVANSQNIELMEYINSITTKKVVITGDFNFTPKNNSYKELDKTNLTDVSDNIPFTYIDKKAKLDYIFTNLKVFMSTNSLVHFDKQPSDHFALLSEIEY